ncbi:hypothetical protein N9L68_05415 [bacterium]|nr:hypothetical protein [bacterium]
MGTMVTRPPPPPPSSAAASSATGPSSHTPRAAVSATPVASPLTRNVSIASSSTGISVARTPKSPLRSPQATSYSRRCTITWSFEKQWPSVSSRRPQKGKKAEENGKRIPKRTL